MIGLFHPGDSWLHRMPVGWKLAALAVGMLALAIRPTTTSVGIAAVVLTALAASARLPAAVVLAQLHPLRWIVLFVAVAQVLLAGPVAACIVVLGLLDAVLAAALVTLTTPAQALLDALVAMLRPLRPLGVNPDRAGFVLALTIRTIPVLSGIVTEVQQARKARGAERSMRAFAVPVTVRTVRYADRLGEALIARGLDD